MPADIPHTFGTCCDSLKEAMAGGEGGEDKDSGFEPLISVGEDGILFMSVGLVSMDDDEPGMIEHPMFFCPFCGTKLQTPEDVDAKSAGSGTN
jgi:hypothetical protein